MPTSSVVEHLFQLIRTNEITKALKLLEGPDRHRLKNAREPTTEVVTHHCKTLLMQAAETGNADLLNTILNLGAAIGTRDQNRRNVLLHACFHGARPEVIDCLLAWNRRRGGKLRLSHCDVDKKGPLILACESGNVETLKCVAARMMRERHCDVLFAKSNNGIRALHGSIEGRREDIALLLLSIPPIAAQFQCEIDYEGYYEERYSKYEPPLLRESVTCVECVTLAIHRDMSTLLRQMHRINPILTRIETFDYCSLNLTRCSIPPYDRQCSEFVRANLDNYIRETSFRNQAGILPLLYMRSRATLMLESKDNHVRPEHAVLSMIPNECLAIVCEFVFVFDQERFQTKRMDIRNTVYRGYCADFCNLYEDV